MRAARFHRYGPPDVLVVEDVPEPVPGPREVLVRVQATSVNPVDTKIRAGYQRAVVRYRLPVVTGLDLAGTVEAVGAEVTRFQPGDAVWSSPSHRRGGVASELACVAESELAPKPPSLTFLEAATIPLAGLTAWQALGRSLRIRRGEQVLIQAGAGGVGSLAIQIAVHLGARVLTTCSAGNAELVRSLGADEAIDYHIVRVEEAARGVDAALEAIGGPALARTRRALRPGGRLVSIVTDLPRLAGRYGPHLGALAAVLRGGGVGGRAGHRGTRVTFLVRRPSAVDLAALAGLVGSGALRPVVDCVLPLEEIAEAHRRSEAGHVRGKIAIAVGPDAERR